MRATALCSASSPVKKEKKETHYFFAPGHAALGQKSSGSPLFISRRTALLELGSLPGLARPRDAGAAIRREECAIEPTSSEPIAAAAGLRRLFAHGLPRYTELHQGSFNDCYFLAALAAAAYRRPAWLKSRVRYIGPGPGGTRIYRVRWAWPRDTGAPSMYDVCVSDAVSPRAAQGALWVAVFEKAFAKLNVQHPFLSLARLQGYDALRSGGIGEGISILTGRQTSVTHFANATAPVPQTADIAARVAALFRDRKALGFMTFNYNPRMRPRADRDAPFHFRFADGCELMAGQSHDTMVFKRPDGRSQVFVGHHAYAVLQVSGRGDLVLYNPHGSNPTAHSEMVPTAQDTDQTLPGTFVLEREYIGHVAVAAYASSFTS